MTYTSGSYHLTDLLSDVLRELGSIQYFTASSGSTSTALNTGTNLTDTSLSGTIFIKDTTDGAAPIGEYSTITGFTPTTGTFTFSPVLTAVVGAGDVFGYANPRYPVSQLIEHCNRGLSKLGLVAVTDTTTLKGVASQSEYASSLAWKHETFRVDLQQITTDSNDNKWTEIRDWEYIPAAAGSTGLIVFKREIPTDHYLRIWSYQRHPRVDAFGDIINEAVHPDLAVASCVMETLRYQNGLTSGEDKFLLQLWNYAREEFDELKAAHPIVATRKGGGFYVPQSNEYEYAHNPDTIRIP